MPAVCDTIISRDEFLTAYVGEAYSDHGKFQALLESSSMLGELTGFEACNTPTYDWANAIAIVCRMASRTSGKKEILLSANMSPGRKAVVKNYCKPDIANEVITGDARKAISCPRWSSTARRRSS